MVDGSAQLQDLEVVIHQRCQQHPSLGRFGMFQGWVNRFDLFVAWSKLVWLVVFFLFLTSWKTLPKDSCWSESIIPTLYGFFQPKYLKPEVSLFMRVPPDIIHFSGIFHEKNHVNICWGSPKTYGFSVQPLGAFRMPSVANKSPEKTDDAGPGDRFVL